MEDLFTPAPGWLSARLIKYGAPVALSVLGIAITLNNGCASDEEINAFYSQLAEEDDSVYLVNEYYRMLEGTHPFLEGYLGGLTAWTEQPSMAHYEHVRQIAALLSKVKWSWAEEWADGDLLGSVYNDMSAIGNRRLEVFDYPTINHMAISSLLQGADEEDFRSFADTWCGSGTRVLGLAKALRLMDRDPNQVKWYLNDPSKVAIAMAGLNMVGAGLTRDVTLNNDRAWAERWMAINGGNPYAINQVPKEVKDEITYGGSK